MMAHTMTRVDVNHVYKKVGCVVCHDYRQESSSLVVEMSDQQQQQVTYGRRPISGQLPRPPTEDAAVFARWLVSQSTWGVLSTIAYDKGGAPFGNVVSFSDGLLNNGTGIPYFFKSVHNATVRYAMKDPRASFALSEYALGTTGNKDPEDPTCARITLIGKLKLLEGNSEEKEFARKALFTRHPDMEVWDKYGGSHHFQIFKLEIEDIYLNNQAGSARPLTVDQYLQAKLNRA